ncbi:MAG: DivIVA domain-containing protein [Candidatus Cloacimonetes bacterium]|nr:DivIVA domain-containing protein [Candidatus Cloacimonadota bacterium]MBL7086227.1 DivIVA domain-containing protein [Candidatus Cloacimonadota bacterium]
MDIKILPEEIRGKEFAKSMSGYKKSEVDDFLQSIANQMEIMLAEIQNLNEKIQEKNKELEKLDEQKELLKKTLILAEKLKEETLQNAKNEAENIIKDAEISSREKVKKAKDYLSILEHDYINLKEKKKQYTISFKAQLNSMLEIIEKSMEQESTATEKQSNTKINTKLKHEKDS